MSEHQSTTQQTVERIMRLKPDFNLCMASFVPNDTFTREEKKQHICQTSYCIAGRLAALDEYPDEFFSQSWTHTKLTFDFNRYSTTLVPDNRIWSFLFSEEWPDDLAQAKMRAAYVRKYSDVPPSFASEFNYDFDRYCHNPEFWSDWYPEMKAYMDANPDEFEPQVQLGETV